jgi:hypothetical protein
MRDSLYIGEVPAAEDAAQVGTDGYGERARKESRALIGQLRRMFGPEKGSARLYVKNNPHDFGSYLSVECSYDDGDEEGMEYAFQCEGEYPEHWDDQARQELGLTGSA